MSCFPELRYAIYVDGELSKAEARCLTNVNDPADYERVTEAMRYFPLMPWMS